MDVGLGMALAGWIGGVIFDMMGSYDLALIISVIASVAGTVSILLLEPTNKLLVPTRRSSPGQKGLNIPGAASPRLVVGRPEKSGCSRNVCILKGYTHQVSSFVLPLIL